MLYLFIFWELSGPSGARIRTNTEVRLALPSAKPSLPRGLLRGNPRTSPKSPTFFSKNFRIQFSRILRKVDARHKRLRNGIGRAVGPPTPPGYGIPTHLPAAKWLMKAKIRAEICLSRTQEHKNLVNKMIRINTEKP